MNAIDILTELIKINTTNPPGNELPAAEYIQSILEKSGFECEVQNLGNNRGNIIASIGNDNGPELMLNGHLDVVPALGDWNSNPFICRFNDGKVYGRGTADMKGGLAAMLSAAISMASRANDLQGRLKLVFVADEEDANLGTLSYLKTHNKSDFAIIGEPTGLNIAIAHRGVARDYILIKGESRHAALPEQNLDSISRTEKAIHAIKELNKELQCYKHDVLPPPSLAITQIEGYEKDNIVPATVKLLLDFRILPGTTYEKVHSILENKLRVVLGNNFNIIPHFYMPGGEISKSDDFANLCLAVRDDIVGQKGRLCSFNASCEQCFFTSNGIKTIILGPGSLKEAHTVDEFTTEEEVNTAEKIYRKIIEKVLINQAL